MCLICFVGHSTKRSGQFSYRSADGAEFGNFPSGKFPILCHVNCLALLVLFPLCEKYVSTGAVQVTAVAYLSQTNSQAVGYNFGCFQIFSLYNLSLV